MIQLSMDEIQPGMRVARSVLGHGAGNQLAAGYVLDEAVIARCRKSGMRSLWVSLDGEDELPAGNVNDQLALQAQHAWKDNMDMLQKIGETQDMTIQGLSKFKSDPGRFKDIIATERLKGVVDQIIKSILSQEALVVNLASMRTDDGYLHQHALDVTITATMLASRLKFPYPDIQEMALGCFLMDLGMIIIPKESMNSLHDPSPKLAHLLSEHPAVGYTILRANSSVPINAAHVAYQHHERMDGGGFPRGLKSPDQFPQKHLGGEGGNFHRYAQVVAVADEYISAISPRPGIEPKSPLEAMRMLIADAGEKLNSHVVSSLITLIPVFPLGTRVLVAKSPKPMLVGHVGVVTRSNPVDKEKPQVLLLFDKFKRRIKPILIDLAEENGFALQFARL
jgi:HD-GYP domain-containing protein (c-di-GMP phosphodiesterase class II)